MDERDLRVDGNAVAGLLSEMFSVEATTVLVTCAGCGSRDALATAHVYMHGPGVVLRCPSCTSVVMRFARIRDRMVADVSGVRQLML
jgi:hypothetical protein